MAGNVVPYWYRAEVSRVVDGDTLDVTIRYDVGFERVLEWEQRVRLARVDAPERRRPTLKEGRAASGWLAGVTPPGSTVWLATSKGDSFGRYIAEVFLTDNREGVSVSDLLVEAGHAVYRDY